MMKPHINIIRKPYEEPYTVRLIIDASNEITSGKLEYFCNTSDLEYVGNALGSFPKQIPDEFLYEGGSEDPKSNSAYLFRLLVYTYNSLGHCAIQLRMNNNLHRPNEELCEFSIKADASDINRLGELIRKFSRLEHTSLVWTVKKGTLED